MIRKQIDEIQPNWYAVYTRSRAEKKLFTLLKQKNVKCFLPLRKTLKQRSDRKKWVQEPLMPSYIFVQITNKERFVVLNTPGAVCYVSFDGCPVPIPEDQINHLNNFISQKEEQVEVYYGSFTKGDLVEVGSGPMKGVQGEVVQIQGKKRLLLRFETLGYCIHIDCSQIEVKNILPAELTNNNSHTLTSEQRIINN